MSDALALRWRFTDFAGLDAPALYAIIALRESIFVVEQACAYQECDGRDPIAWHLCGYAEDQLTAYLRVFPPDAGGDVVIGRVVVRPDARGGGLGTRLMAVGLERAARQFGPAPVRISAQAHLQGFYEALGFVVIGPSYLEDGIPHRPMRRPGGVAGA